MVLWVSDALCSRLSRDWWLTEPGHRAQPPRWAILPIPLLKGPQGICRNAEDSGKRFPGSAGPSRPTRGGKEAGVEGGDRQPWCPDPACSWSQPGLTFWASSAGRLKQEPARTPSVAWGPAKDPPAVSLPRSGWPHLPQAPAQPHSTSSKKSSLPAPIR